MSERVVPHNLDAERSLLGAVLLDSAVYKLAPDVAPRDFFRAAHGLIWSAFGRLSDAGTAIDFVTLSEELTRSKGLDAVGGVIYLNELITGVPRSTNFEHYAKIIREKATLRRLIEVSTRTIDDAYAATDDVETVIDQASARVMDIGRASAKGEFVLASDWMASMFPAFERAMTEKRIVTGVPSGLPALDALTRGFQKGDLIILAARPSMGKTALSLQMATEAGQHVMVGYESLEMPKEAIGWRRIALESKIDAFRLMTGDLSEREMRIAADAMNRISESRFAIDDVSGQTCAAVCAKFRRAASRHGMGFGVIDYVQLMTSGERSGNRTEDIGVMARRLKTLARELDMPLLVLSQLTRENERDNRPPKLSDLREGGDLEQAADVVLFLHRPEKQTDAFGADERMELILAKQRNGRARVTLDISFHGPTMRFYSKPTEQTAPEQGRFA